MKSASYLRSVRYQLSSTIGWVLGSSHWAAEGGSSHCCKTSPVWCVWAFFWTLWSEIRPMTLARRSPWTSRFPFLCTPAAPAARELATACGKDAATAVIGIRAMTYNLLLHSMTNHILMKQYLTTAISASENNKRLKKYFFIFYKKAIKRLNLLSVQ